MLAFRRVVRYPPSLRVGAARVIPRSFCSSPVSASKNETTEAAAAPASIMSSIDLGARDPNAALSADLRKEIEKLHAESIAPLNALVRGPLQEHDEQISPLPFVLVIGNHSSGKSTFINHVLGREVQVRAWLLDRGRRACPTPAICRPLGSPRPTTDSPSSRRAHAMTIKMGRRL